MVVPIFSAYGEEIAICRLGDKDSAVWGELKRYFNGKGVTVTFYDGTDSIERQVEMANRVNRGKASFFLVVDLAVGDRDSVIVAVTDAKKGKGNILSIDEVPATHGAASREAAKRVASSFGPKIRVRELPLFPFLGIDLPGIFLSVEHRQEKTGEILDALYSGLESYLKRGIRHEK